MSRLVKTLLLFYIDRKIHVCLCFCRKTLQLQWAGLKEGAVLLEADFSGNTRAAAQKHVFLPENMSENPQMQKSQALMVAAAFSCDDRDLHQRGLSPSAFCTAARLQDSVSANGYANPAVKSAAGREPLPVKNKS